LKGKKDPVAVQKRRKNCHGRRVVACERRKGIRRSEGWWKYIVGKEKGYLVRGSCPKARKGRQTSLRGGRKRGKKGNPKTGQQKRGEKYPQETETCFNEYSFGPDLWMAVP